MAVELRFDSGEWRVAKAVRNLPLFQHDILGPLARPLLRRFWHVMNCIAFKGINLIDGADKTKDMTNLVNHGGQETGIAGIQRVANTEHAIAEDGVVVGQYALADCLLTSSHLAESGKREDRQKETQ